MDGELLQDGLGWCFEAEAFARCEVVHEEDVLELLVGDFVDVDFPGQVSS